MKFIVYIQDSDVNDSTPAQVADMIHEAVREHSGAYANVYVGGRGDTELDVTRVDS